jgi:Protein of unknown function (DUF998)
MTTTIVPVRDPVRTRLTAGVLAAPLFLLISALQMPFNPGLDLTKHAFSYLSIGATGPLQQTDFVLMGLAHIVAATGLVRVLAGRAGYVAAALLAVDGLGQVIAGLFTLDPSNGFPQGAPPGLPETVTTSGNLHGLGFGLSIVSWVALLVVLARWFARARRRAWSRGCIAAAVALLVTAGCLMTPFGTVLLYAVLTSTWIYTALVLRHLRDTRLG